MTREMNLDKQKLLSGWDATIETPQPVLKTRHIFDISY